VLQTISSHQLLEITIKFRIISLKIFFFYGAYKKFYKLVERNLSRTQLSIRHISLPEGAFSAEISWFIK